MLHTVIGRQNLWTPNQHILSRTRCLPASSRRLCNRRSCNPFHTGDSHEPHQRVTASSSGSCCC